MVQIQALVNFQLEGSSIARGQVLAVTRNIAHGLIDSGKACLYVQPKTGKKTKEMTAKKNKIGYITK